MSELKQYWNAGATHFKLAIVGGGDHIEQMRAIADQGLPAVRGWG